MKKRKFFISLPVVPKTAARAESETIGTPTSGLRIQLRREAFEVRPRLAGASPPRITARTFKIVEQAILDNKKFQIV